MAGVPEFEFVRKIGNQPVRAFVVGRGCDCRIHTRALQQSIGRRLSERFQDLIDIALAIYVADRSTKRYCRFADGARSLELKIGVRDKAFWSGREARLALQRCLEFLTGDDWSIRFSKREPRLDSNEFQRSLFVGELQSGSAPLVCLYSGGLDSAAGLALRCRDACAGRYVPVTVWHQSQQRNNVQSQFSVLRKTYGCEIDPVIVKVAMTSPSKLDREETSQRARAVLFYAVGAAVADAVGSHVIEVFESGVGAANVPFMAGMVGWRTTRGAHPEYMRLAGALASLVADRDITFTLPFVGKTKAEVVRAAAVEGLTELLHLTNSCVRFPLHQAGPKSCGICPGCILRRQAFASAGVDDPPGAYQHDIIAASDNGILSRDARAPLNAILLQAIQMAALNSAESPPNWLRNHLIGTLVADEASVPDWLGLFGRYGREWIALNPGSRIRAFGANGTIQPNRSKEGAYVEI